MRFSLRLSVLFLMLVLFAASASGQWTYRWNFQGTSHQTNSTGNIVPLALTERTFIEDAAQRGGWNTNDLVMIYHIGGSGFGDVVKIVHTNGQTVATPFGFFFGEDASLGRTGLTNSTQTEVRRVDYIYTLENSTFTSWNSHSMGAALITRRYVKDTDGNTFPTIEGPMQWTVLPQGTNGARICHGTFTTGVLYP